MAEYRSYEGLVVQKDVRRMSIDAPNPVPNQNGSYHVFNNSNNFNIRTITSTTTGPSVQTRSFSFLMPNYSFLLPVSQPQVGIGGVQENGYLPLIQNSPENLRPVDIARLVKTRALEAMPRYIWVLDSLLQTDSWEDREKATKIRRESILHLQHFIENGTPEEILPVVQMLNNLYNSNDSGIQSN